MEGAIGLGGQQGVPSSPHPLASPNIITAAAQRTQDGEQVDHQQLVVQGHQLEVGHLVGTGGSRWGEEHEQLLREHRVGLVVR